MCVSGMVCQSGLLDSVLSFYHRFKLRLSGFYGRGSFLPAEPYHWNNSLNPICICLSISVGLDVRGQLLGVSFLFTLWFCVLISDHQFCDTGDLPLSQLIGPLHIYFKYLDFCIILDVSKLYSLLMKCFLKTIATFGRSGNLLQQ